MFDFPREGIFPSWFANRIQDFLSAARTDLRVSLKDADTVQVVPDTELGITAIALEGRWRFNTATVQRDHPGGAKGTYVLWAVSEDNDVDDTPKPHTDHTDYAFDLRITSGANPSGSGVVIFEKIAELDWSGTEIEAIRQTHGSITGAMLADGTLSSEASSDVTWTRAPGGGLIAGIKPNAIGATELADESVDTAALIDLAIVTAKVAALAITEAKLAPNSVATEKIIALAVTAAKLAAGSVIEEKLGAEAVSTAKIKLLAVTSAVLAVESVTTEKVGNLAITEAKLAAESVGTGKIKNLAVTAPKIAAEAVETAKIANLGVTTAKIAELAVTESKIADAAVSSRKFKPTSGLVTATAGSTVLEAAYKDIPGATLEITPAVASTLFVFASWDLNVNGGGGAGADAEGTISLDGVDQARPVKWGQGGATQIWIEVTMARCYRLALTAALHTIKMRAKIANGAAEAVGERTDFFYLLVAS